MKITHVVGIFALASLLPATSWAGLGDSLKGKLNSAKSAATCDDDKGVEAAGKDMDDKAYNGLINTQKALVAVADASGDKGAAKTAHANLDKWGNKEKAPSGSDRIKAISSASADIQKFSGKLSDKKDPAAQKALVDARNDLRMAVIYVAWGAKIGEPIPANAKAAIAANKACSTKVKEPADAAAGLSTLSAKIKSTYSAVSDAAKKSGAPDMSDADKQAQDSQIGAPAGVGT